MLKRVKQTHQVVWALERLANCRSYSVDSLVPSGFASYARILHPAWKPVGRSWTNISWEEVATRRGFRVQALTDWHEINISNSDSEGIAEPDEGRIPAAVIDPLRNILSLHTCATPCWVGVWRGWGLTNPKELWETATLDSGLGREYALFRMPLEWIDVAFDEFVGEGSVMNPIVSYNPESGWWRIRRFVSSENQFEIGSRPMKYFSFYPYSPGQTANIFWSDDRSWWITNDIDLNSSYIGGTVELIDDILSSDKLEAWPVSAKDEFS